MKKVICLSSLACVITLSAGSAFAGMSTITGGYAQGANAFVKEKVDGLGKPKGLNIKYRYEFDNSPWGVITSFTFNGSSHRFSGSDDTEIKHSGLNFNLSAGPTYRINDWVSVYGLVGVSYRKLKTSWDLPSKKESFSEQERDKEDISKSGTGFTYGAGVQFNPMENLALDFSYEQSHVKIGKPFDKVSKTNLGTFVIGVGYRF